MNNNEEKIVSTETEESVETKPEGKKLSKGALIGIICGAVAVVVAIVLIILLTGGNKCTAHVDTNGDNACDNCGEYVPSSNDNQNSGEDQTTDDETNTSDDNDQTGVSEEITFQVKLDNGEFLSGVAFKLYNNKKEYNLVSGDGGSVKWAVGTGTYYVEFDYETLPEYCWGDTEKVTISKDTTVVVLDVTDSRPDGSAKKPYYVSDEPIEITLGAGEEIFFSYRGASAKYIRVYHSSAVVCYDGQEYPAVDGATDFLLQPDGVAGGLTIFSIKNSSAEEFTATMEVVAPLGTNENPHEMIGNSLSISLLPESLVYYKWVADKDGVLVVNTSTLKSEISVTKVLENDVPISSSTYGDYYAYLVVKAGDVITISISALAPTAEEVQADPTVAETAVEINIDFVVCAGTDTDPVPVLKDHFDISFGAGDQIVFLGEAGKTVVIESEPDVYVIYGGQSILPDANGNISLTLTDSGWFTVVNTLDGINGVSIEIN